MEPFICIVYEAEAMTLNNHFIVPIGFTTRIFFWVGQLLPSMHRGVES